MTLILTELTPLGIVMVGDTAVTIGSKMPDHTIQDRAFDGLTKVIPVHKINAGLSYWGWCHIKPFNDINGIPFDWWINNFLMVNHGKYNNLEDLALLLESNLREVIPELSKEELSDMYKFGNGGIHLAGYKEIETDGELVKMPSFWHIHNGYSQSLPEKDIDESKVNANHDISPGESYELFQNNRIYYTVNGENITFNMLVRRLRTFLKERFEGTDTVIPINNLMARADYWKAIISFISNLYQVSGTLIHTEKYDIIFDYPVSVGDEITVLTMKPRGITNYFTQ